MKTRSLIAATSALLLMSASAMAAELKIGLGSDADVLDPAQSRTFVGRIVYTAMCDKLVDVSPDLKIVPQLATEWTWSDDGKELTMKLREGVKFHDGTPFNAEAVVATIDRNINLPESRRKSELSSVEKVEAIGENEVKFKLKSAGCHLARPAGGPCRDDGLAESRQGARRKLRQSPGLRRAVQIRRARPAGPHRAGKVPGLLEQGQCLPRQGHLSADPRYDRSPGQPAVRRSRHGRRAWRRAMRRRSRRTPT